MLPATWKWKESIPKLNTVDSPLGLKDVSKSNLSKIRKLNFPEYDAKKPRDNFACCCTCNRLHSLRRIAVVGSQAAMLWAQKLKLHLQSAMAHRELYSANRYRSRFLPSECITIMHDKMDHAKIAFPIFSYKTKQLDGLMKLPISITSMLAHGHGDVHYAHYGLDIFVHDANYIIGSFAKLLQDLEKPPKSLSRRLFDGSRSSPLFEAMLSRVEMCEGALPQLLGIPCAATPLPPILNVQMECCRG